MNPKPEGLLAKIKSLPRIYLVTVVTTIIVLVVAMGVIGVNIRNRGTLLEQEKNAKKQIKLVRDLTINGKVVEAELASTPEERMRGLMYRTELADGKGMLFTFGNDGSYPFWMKNMKIPIDIVWIDSGLTIVDADKNVPACTQDNCELYTPAKPVRYVLELPAGWMDKNGANIGDKIEMGETKILTTE